MTPNYPVRSAPAMVKPCAMYKDHGSAFPSETEGHHRHPQYMQVEVYGKVKDLELLYLCGNCHSNVHAWLYWLTGKRSKPNPIPPFRSRQEAEFTFEWYTQAKLAMI